MFFIKQFLCTLLLSSFIFGVDARESVSMQETSNEQVPPKSSLTTSILTLSESSKAGEPGATLNQQIKIIQIKGAISRKLLANLKSNITATADDPIPAGLIILLDSRGGDGMAAIQIGRLLRKANAHVFVNGECSSACILVLAGGVVRGAPTFSIGIHQARVTLSTDAGVIKREVSASEDPQAKFLLEKFDASAKTYFSDMEIPPDLFIAMQSHPSRRVYRLSSHEITAYGLNGMESNYVNERAQMYAQRPGRWPKDSDELMRRTAKVSTECMRFDNNPVDFTKCYRKVLQDIY
jgi:ATP-dependent protease ClpP protease subunit